MASPAVCRSLPLQPPRPSLRRFPARASYYQWPGGQRTAARQDKTGCSAVFDNPFGTEPGFRCKRHNDLRVVCLEINFPTFGCIAGSPGALTFTRSSGPKAARSGRSVVEDWWLTVAPAVSWPGRPCRQPRTSGSPAPELDPYPADLPYRARLQMGTSAAYVLPHESEPTVLRNRCERTSLHHHSTARSKSEAIAPNFSKSWEERSWCIRRGRDLGPLRRPAPQSSTQSGARSGFVKSWGCCSCRW